MLKKLLFLAALALFPATAHAQAPNVIPGCVYNSTPPTLADKQTVAIQCDSAGKLKTTGGSIGPGVATTCTALTLLYADASSLLQCSKTIPFGVTFQGNTVVSSGSFGLSGNISAAAWTTAGIRYANVAATLTDTTSSGAVAAAYTDFFGGNTIAASAAATFTNYYTSYFTEPTAGTNVTLTNKWALGADSARINGQLNLNGNGHLFGDLADSVSLHSSNGQTLYVYGQYNNASSYTRLLIGTNVPSNHYILSQSAGGGSNDNFHIGTATSAPLDLWTNNTSRWTLGGTTGHFLATTDNIYDIGAVGATRPRTGYFGTSLRAPVYASVGTVPTLALAGGTCAGTAIAGGSTAGTVTLSGVCVATNTLTLSVMPTAPTGYACDATDRTLGTVALAQTGTSTTTAVFTFLATTGGTDVLSYKCIAY